MSELPATWQRTSLGKVVDYGKTSKAEPEDISGNTWVLELEDIEKDTSRLIARLRYEERLSKSTKNRFKAGDVLYGKLRPYLNKVLIADRPGVCTTEILPLNSDGYLDNRFLFYWLKSPEFLEYVVKESHGMNMPRLGTDAGKVAPFIIAPLPEQKRIADKLDSTLARVDACRNRLDRLPALLKRFRQSILAAATSGRLTEDWRATRSLDEMQRDQRATAPSIDTDVSISELPADWRQTDVQSVAQVGTGSTPLRSNPAFYADVGTPWITSAATSQEIVTSAEQFVTTEGVTAHRLKIYPIGTLLVGMYGEGKTRGQVTELGIPATINQACAAVVVDEAIALKAYVKLALQANYLEMRELAEGGNQPNLNLSKIKEFPLALPTIPEQHEIVRRVETLFAFADRLEARLATARKQAEQLTPALLAKAFRGELVPQDPDDEPASELLKRLAASRTDAPKPRPGRKAAA